MQLLSTVRLDQSLRHNGRHRDMMWAHLRLRHVAIAIFFFLLQHFGRRRGGIRGTSPGAPDAN